MTKKVAIIGTVGLPANYGGFETLVEYITKEINNEFDITIYCSAKAYETQLPSYNNCKLHYINLDANGVQSVIYDVKAIIKAIKYADVLLILGVSGCISLPFVKLFSRKKVIVNIDGLEWKRQKWNTIAKWFLKWSEKLAVTYADTIIADNEVIKNYVLNTYKKEARLIAYGGNHCLPKVLKAETLNSYPFLNDSYAFKVCRIEPENNIELILTTFAKCSKLPLVIIGNWDNSAFGAEMKLKFQGYKHLHLLDAVYNLDVLNQIRSNCYVYIHGHSAGGTNPSLVEAMSLALPIIAFDVDYNRATTSNKAWYFKDNTELFHLIESLDASALKAQAAAMASLANTHYTWKEIARQYQFIINTV